MKSNLNYYVYGHYTADTNELFYIGKGCNKRAWKKQKRNPYWNNIVNKHGFTVNIFIDNLSESSAFIQEILGIKRLQPKANLTKGGEGVVGIVYTKARLKKSSETMKTMYKKIPELKKKITKAVIEYNRRPDNRKKQSERMKCQIANGDFNQRTYWTNKEIRDSRAVKYGSKPFTVFLKDEVIGVWINKTDCARELKIHRENLRKCLKGNRNTTGGYRFEYV